MATKYVNDTAAGKSISAWVILDKRRRYVATVRSYYSDGGRVLVNIFQTDAAAKRCGPKLDASKAHDLFGFQHASAGGYGYDKLTAALSGLMIDGHALTDHCGARQPLPKGATLFPEDFKPKPGYRLANWQGSREKPNEPRGYGDCYRTSGLDYLRELGYELHQAI